MEVNLINYTQNAEDLLIYTKHTRLTQGKEAREKLLQLSADEKLDELKYIASSVPSCWEFVDYTFEILNVTRAFTHQLVRTRHGSYAQQSMRVVDMAGFSYRSDVIGKDKKQECARVAYGDCMEQIEKTYRALIDLGVPAEAARGVLPTNICTSIIAKFNLRTLSELMKNRSGPRTQREYRGVLREMFACVIAVHPWAVQFLSPDRLADAQLLEEIAGAYITSETKLKSALRLIDKLKR